MTTTTKKYSHHRFGDPASSRGLSWYKRPELIIQFSVAIIAGTGVGLGWLLAAQQWKTSVETEVKSIKESVARMEKDVGSVKADMERKADRIQLDVEKAIANSDNLHRERNQRLERTVENLSRDVQDLLRGVRK